MNTEQKAKAYDEALERAKKLIKTSVAYDRFTIEKIFPELKESENKKMTLNEAINHCEEVTLSCAKSNRECALEHVQLMQWLKELRVLRQLVKPNHMVHIKSLQSAFGKEWEEEFNRLLRYDVTGPFADRFK